MFVERVGKTNKLVFLDYGGDLVVSRVPSSNVATRREIEWVSGIYWSPKRASLNFCDKPWLS